MIRLEAWYHANPSTVAEPDTEILRRSRVKQKRSTLIRDECLGTNISLSRTLYLQKCTVHTSEALVFQIQGLSISINNS